MYSKVLKNIYSNKKNEHYIDWATDKSWKARPTFESLDPCECLAIRLVDWELKSSSRDGCLQVRVALFFFLRRNYTLCHRFH